MTSLRQMIRFCAIALPVLLVALAVVASATVLAAGASSLAERAVLRGATVVLLLGTVVDVVLLVALLGWHHLLVAESDSRQQGVGSGATMETIGRTARNGDVRDSSSASVE